MKKLFGLIAALRKGKKLQPYALNNSDQVSSDEEEVMQEQEEEEEEHDSLTASEFESDDDKCKDDKYDLYRGNYKKDKKGGPKPKHEKKTESVEKAPSPPRNSVGGSSGSGRSKEQKELDKVMAEIADLEHKMKLDEIHLYYFNLVP